MTSILILGILSVILAGVLVTAGLLALIRTGAN